MMGKYKVVYDRPNCIGAAQCVAAFPEFWSMNKDGKADLKGSKKTDGSFELEMDDATFPKMKDSASVCPVNVIHIIEKKTGKRLV